MTVLIAATGAIGDAAAAALDDVVRVETVAATREHLGSVPVAVVGPLADGDPAVLLDCTAPFVHLGPHEAFEACLPVDFEPAALREAVAAAREVAAYRRAVDELYELCAEAATSPPSEELLRELDEARERADERFAAASASEYPYWELLTDED